MPPNIRTGPIGFLAPSKNIVCQFFADNGQGVLRCDIMNMDARPRRPADCELDWGHAFEISAKGAASRICAGTVMDPLLPVLAYGEVLQRGGFTCQSEQTGLTCFNARCSGDFHWLGRSRRCFEDVKNTQLNFPYSARQHLLLAIVEQARVSPFT